jgi:hypothetical protein
MKTALSPNPIADSLTSPMENQHGSGSQARWIGTHQKGV